MNQNTILSTPDITDLVALLRLRATLQPDAMACTFLRFKGEGEDDRVTYRQLDEQARSIAAWLQVLGAAGKHAILLYPSGLPYMTAFFACLYADVLAIPAYPPHSERFVPRIRAIVQDSQATVILTTTQIKSGVKRWFAGVPELEKLEWLTTDDIPVQMADAWQEPLVTPENLAFLQYTSGSTSLPKGVMVSHGNLLHNLKLQQQIWGQTAESIHVSWLPIFHDMGLIAGLLLPLYLGAPVYLLAPASFLQRPLRWLQTISKYRATSSCAPNFGYELCARRSTPEVRAGLDLRSWTLAMNGAEPVHSATMERFSEVFAPCGFAHSSFAPAYGLAEATLVVSSVRRDALPLIKTLDKQELEQHRAVAVEAGSPKPVYQAVSCGPVAPDQHIVIVHPELKITCPPDRIGEIWISGPSIAQGYWQRQEMTSLTFHAYLADSGEGPFLRTGDLGFMSDGELFITGRIKDVIIIRGRNCYPQDIEATVEKAHPAIRLGACAAFSIEAENEERLVVVAEVDHRYKPDSQEPGSETLMEPNTIVKMIREAVAIEHDLQVTHIQLLRVGGIQKTSSGKIQRSACRAKFLDGSLSRWGGPADSNVQEEREAAYGGSVCL